VKWSGKLERKQRGGSEVVNEFSINVTAEITRISNGLLAAYCVHFDQLLGVHSGNVGTHTTGKETAGTS
jgi:hypothetical protein